MQTPHCTSSLIDWLSHAHTCTWAHCFPMSLPPAGHSEPSLDNDIQIDVIRVRGKAISWPDLMEPPIFFNHSRGRVFSMLKNFTRKKPYRTCIIIPGHTRLLLQGNVAVMDTGGSGWVGGWVVWRGEGGVCSNRQE